MPASCWQNPKNNPAAPDGFRLRGGKLLAWGLVLAALAWFAMFYPIHTAVRMPN